MGRVEQKTIEEIAEKVAVSVRGVTEEQVKQIIEEKMKGPALGYRAIGKRVGLKKDKVMETWKKCEPMLALTRGIPGEPGKPRDEGEFYAEAFSTIGKLLERGCEPADIVIELVKRFKVLPAKAREAVQSFFEQKRFNVVNLEKEWKGRLIALEADVRSLRQKIESLLPVSQRVKQLEGDTGEITNSLNRVIDDLNEVTDTLAMARLMVKFRSIPKLKKYAFTA